MHVTDYRNVELSPEIIKRYLVPKNIEEALKVKKLKKRIETKQAKIEKLSKEVDLLQKELESIYLFNVERA